MTPREEFKEFENAFGSLDPRERAAILSRATARVAALGKRPDHFAYPTLVRLERDRLIAQERPSMLPPELRRSAAPTRERHEPINESEED